MPTIWNDLLHLFYPNLCAICKKPLVEGEEQICLECLYDLPHTRYHKQTNNPAEQRFAGKVRIEYGSAYLLFEKGGVTQCLIHALKYRDNKELGFLLGRQAGRELLADHSPLCQADLLIPIPLHPRKQRKRGYNQSEWIADGISSALGIPVRTDCVSRLIPNNSQVRLSIYERWLNTCSIFKTTLPEALENKHVILIDDVITTGATTTACAEALQVVPGIRISVFSLSIT